MSDYYKPTKQEMLFQFRNAFKTEHDILDFMSEMYKKERTGSPYTKTKFKMFNFKVGQYVDVDISLLEKWGDRSGRIVEINGSQLVTTRDNKIYVTVDESWCTPREWFKPGGLRGCLIHEYKI